MSKTVPNGFANITAVATDGANNAVTRLPLTTTPPKAAIGDPSSAAAANAPAAGGGESSTPSS